MKKPVKVNLGPARVEMRGVEPLSENTSAGLSPSAFRGFDLQAVRADARH